MSNHTILPTGFYDLYAEDALKQYDILKKITDFLISRNFSLFIPTALEFSHNSTSQNHLANLNSEKFLVHDPLSKEMLKIRNDITTQISRALNYDNSAKAKICYYGDIYYPTISSSEQRRKFTQAGFEIIDEQDDNLGSEMIAELAEAIKILKLKKFNLILSFPTITFNLLKKYKITDKENFIQDVNSLNLSSLEKNYNITAEDLELIIGVSVAEPVKIKKLISSEDFKILTLCQTYLNKQANDIIINSRVNKNHKNFSMSLISLQSNATYIRGGDYKIKNKNGIGVSFFIDEIAKV